MFQNDFDPIAADAAAAEAAKQLPTLKTAKQLAEWWHDHLMTAGHKRLHRVVTKHYGLSSFSKKAAKPDPDPKAHVEPEPRKKANSKRS